MALVRIESAYKRMWGWQARVYLGPYGMGVPGKKRYRSKWFSDRKWGGKEEAKTAAQHWMKDARVHLTLLVRKRGKQRVWNAKKAAR